MQIGDIRPAGASIHQRVTQNAHQENGDNSGEILTEDDMRLREKANIETALKYTDWKIYGTGGTAELLGSNPPPSSPASKKMGIERAR